ncbi:hypothetical protein C8R47DRAFT_1064448 [Mycena vitilis]|nr:hypothetical protein C8R47DRAFT_1064448 [Mycena vitilis]
MPTFRTPAPDSLMPPKLKKTIKTLKDTGNAQRFLHRRVGDPNPDHFDKKAYTCKYKAEHVYQLSMGKDDEDLISLWTIQCLGDEGKKCSPTVAERPPNWAAIRKGHHDALEEFKKVDNTAARLVAAAAKVEVTLRELDKLAGGPPLPLIDERRIGALLNKTQVQLENLEYGILAGFPRPAADLPRPDAGGKRKAKLLNHNGKGKDKRSTKKPSESPSPGSEDADHDGDAVQGPHVSNTPQLTLWPTWMDDPMEDSNAVAKLTAVIYAKAHYAPEVVLMAVPKWTCFEFSDYGAPAGPGFEGFSVVNEKYKDVHAPISLENRGDLMVFRKRDVFVVDCPGIQKWEEEAVFSRDMEASSPIRDRAPSASTQSPRSSQPWPPSTRASGSSQPLASSSKRPFNIPDRELRSRKKMRLNNHGYALNCECDKTTPRLDGNALESGSKGKSICARLATPHLEQTNMDATEFSCQNRSDSGTSGEFGHSSTLDRSVDCEVEYDEWETEASAMELEEKKSRVVRAIVFTRAHDQPIQRLLYCSVETRFKFMSYPVAQDTEPGAGYLIYSVYSEMYRDAEEPMNLKGRGHLMVYRDNTLRRIDCPGIETWEDEARRLARLEAANMLLRMDRETNGAANLMEQKVVPAGLGFDHRRGGVPLARPASAIIRSSCPEYRSLDHFDTPGAPISSRFNQKIRSEDMPGRGGSDEINLTGMIPIITQSKKLCLQRIDAAMYEDVES